MTENPIWNHGLSQSIRLQNWGNLFFPGPLAEEKLALELRGRGFDLIEFNGPAEFRYAYESKYRSIWDRGKHTDLVVILRLQDVELESLPYLITHQFQLSRLISNRRKNNGLHWLFHRVASLHCQIWPKSTLVCIIVRIQVCLCRRGWTRLNWAAWRLKMVGNQVAL
ncbi:hypothetical protein [Thiolapillus sp.]|uniref:hypothetical protein n=1 Tax=Thiolapillus sp. TaxID=2017437 RepID=UPI003AF7AA1F